MATARRALQELNNLKRVGAEFKSEDTGTLAIATTHTQARYVLPPVLKRFAERYPKVRLLLHQGNPSQVAEQTQRADVDVGIATEALADYPGLVSLPCYTWNRCVLVPKGHPLGKARPLTLEALARYPIVTYDFSFTGRSQINAAFAAKGIEPNVVLTALDSDVIKTYVELGFGVGIVAQMAYDPARDTAIREARRRPSVRRQHDAPGASPRRLPARLRLRVHHACSRRNSTAAAIDAALQGKAESYELYRSAQRERDDGADREATAARARCARGCVGGHCAARRRAVNRRAATSTGIA